MSSRLKVVFKWGCTGDSHSYVSLNCVAAVRIAYATPIWRQRPVTAALLRNAPRYTFGPLPFAAKPCLRRLPASPASRKLTFSWLLAAGRLRKPIPERKPLPGVTRFGTTPGSRRARARRCAKSPYKLPSSLGQDLCHKVAHHHVTLGAHNLCKPTFANPGQLSTTTTRLPLAPGRTGATRS